MFYPKYDCISLSVHAFPLAKQFGIKSNVQLDVRQYQCVQHKGGGMKQNGIGPDNGCSEKGFALLELMIVVVIVAILAAIAAPSFARLAKKPYLSGSDEEHSIHSEICEEQDDQHKFGTPGGVRN